MGSDPILGGVRLLDRGAALAPVSAAAQAIETVKVAATPAAERVVTLPGELTPFQATAVAARVAGFVEQVHVDRGALVRQGQTRPCCAARKPRAIHRPMPVPEVLARAFSPR